MRDRESRDIPAQPLELDFACEAENSQRIARAFEGDARVHVPGVIDALIGLRVSPETELKGLHLAEHGMESYGGFQIFTT